MKITDVKPLPITVGSRSYLFVKVETDEGISGLGEYGLTFKESAGIGAIRHMATHVKGCNPLDIERIWQILLRGDFFPGGKVNMAAMSAIDIALWDILGKACGQPVYRLLGGRTRERVPCYVALGGPDPDAIAAAAVEKVKEGWKFLRFGTPDRDGILDASQAVRDSLDIMTAVRDAVGPEPELIIDVHTRLDPPDAVRLCRKLEPLDLFFIEDPLRSENPQAYRHLRNHVSAPLGVGEQYAGKWEFRQIIEEHLADYARIDFCIVGGITEARKIAGWCETHYIKTVPHNPLGPVSAAACLHLDLAIDNFAVQEAGSSARPDFLDDLFPVRFESEPGWWRPNDRPGLGVELNEEALDRYPFREETCPRFQRLDGSFTNW